MEVAEPEVLGPVDDDGVGVGDVDAGLDDGGRDEHVVVVVGEVEDDFFQLLGGHLPVADGNACVGDGAVEHLFEFREAVDAVVDEEDLSVAAHLEVDGIGHDFG